MTTYITRFAFIAAVVFSALAVTPVALAHDGEDHGEKTELSIEQMEQMIVLLNKVVALLTEYRAQYGMYQTESHTDAHAAEEEDDHAATSDDEHEEGDEHDEHGDEEVSGEEAKLVIEIEPHSGKTHVHIRYTDKPEEMYFADVAITDEDGIVASIVARTGMSAEIVREALKYMQ